MRLEGLLDGGTSDSGASSVVVLASVSLSVGTNSGRALVVCVSMRSVTVLVALRRGVKSSGMR
jgi:hypothetical protein